MKTTTDEQSRTKFWEIISSVQTSNAIDSTNFDMLIFGKGGQTRRFYREISNDPDIELLWTGSGTPYRILRKLVAYECGLLKVCNVSQLSRILEEVGSNTECGLYYVHKSLTSQILLQVNQNLYNMDLSEILLNEHPSFLMDINFDTDGDGEHIERSIKYTDNLPQEICDILQLC